MGVRRMSPARDSTAISATGAGCVIPKFEEKIDYCGALFEDAGRPERAVATQQYFD